MSAVRISAHGAGKSRTALLESPTAVRDAILKFNRSYDKMLIDWVRWGTRAKFLVLGHGARTSFPSVRTPWPWAKYFLSDPATQSISTYYECAGLFATQSFYFYLKATGFSVSPTAPPVVFIFLLMCVINGNGGERAACFREHPVSLFTTLTSYRIRKTLHASDVYWCPSRIINVIKGKEQVD